MRLAITFQRVDPSKGGAETYVADLLHRLVAAGHDTTLIASEWKVEALPSTLRFVKIEPGGFTRSQRIANFAKDAETAMREGSFDCALGFINTWSQDILVPQGGVHEASLGANAMRFSAGWKRSLYLASKKLNPRWWGLYRRIEKAQYSPDRSTRCVAVSHMVARDVARFHHVPANRIRVIPNAIDAARLSVPDPQESRRMVRKRHGLAEDALVALFVAHNFRLKGLPPLLEAMAERRDKRPVHLLVCGGGKIPPMQRLVDRLRLSKVVHLVGFAPSVKDYFHAADFFVLPSYYDPCSLVVFEALACGLPVITTTCNGAGEVMTQGREGFVISTPDDRPAMIAALDQMSDDELRREMSKNAVVLGREQSLDRHVSRLLEFCEEVAAEKRSAGLKGMRGAIDASVALARSSSFPSGTGVPARRL
jgi:UDP-glucose:(heptosyl)LPS alpha-1,3-glucosyltransferase